MAGNIERIIGKRGVYYRVRVKLPPNPGNLVFTTKKGKCPWAGPIHKSFGKVCRAFQIPYITVYGLGHTHATMLLRRGHSVNAVAQRLGDKPATIIKYYGHVTPGMQAEILRTILRGLCNSRFSGLK